MSTEATGCLWQADGDGIQFKHWPSSDATVWLGEELLNQLAGFTCSGLTVAAGSPDSLHFCFWWQSSIERRMNLVLIESIEGHFFVM